MPFTTTTVDTPEDLDSPLARNPAALAEALAAEKAVAARVVGHSDELIACFDTIVVHDGGVLGKPLDEGDAWRMLRALSRYSTDSLSSPCSSTSARRRPRSITSILFTKV